MSQASEAIGNGAASGAGATTSTPCAASIRLPPSAPSRASRPMSLRPIIPAAPITRIFNGVPSHFLDPAIVGAERARSPRYTAGASGSRILARVPIASACYTV